MNYSFDTSHAVRFGVDEAIVLHNLIYWISKNKANGTNEHAGRTWTYSSASAFAKLFPFWNARKISRILGSLEDQQVIQSGNFNKVAYDRTKWYSLVDESPFVKIDTWKNANCPMDALEVSNGMTESVQPIPDKNTYSKTDENKEKGSLSQKSEKQLRIEKLFNRRPSTPYDKSETSAWRSAKSVVEELTEFEWTKLETFYAAPQRETYRRKSLATLLNNISGEVENALQWKPKHTTNRTAIGAAPIS